MKACLIFLLGLVLACDGVAGPSASLPEPSPTPTYQNPIYRHNAPDPSVIRDADGTFYAFTTQSFYGDKKVNIPILRSTDLFEWIFAADAFPTLPSWVLTGEDGDTWAPHVIRHRDKYYMYFSARAKSTRTLGIGVATATDLLGPWTARREPLIVGPRYTTIDPFIFRTRTGKLFIYWGSAGDPIRMQELSRDGFSLVGGPSAVLAPSSKPYEGNIEGAWLVKQNGYFYLFYSGDRCCYAKAHYAVMVARARSMRGPFKRFAENPIVTADGTFKAPGHIATIADTEGRCWMLYHAMDATEDSGLRYLMLDPIDWRRGWPSINDDNGPSSDSRPAPVVSGERSTDC